MSINLCLIYFLPIRRFKCSFFYNTSLIAVSYTHLVLSAINLGVKPPIVSLGSLITDASENLQYYSYQVLISALALVFISLAFILLGEDGLRDAFDLKI